MITILLGDVSEYLWITALSVDQSAQLISDPGPTTLVDGTYYTSFGEFQNKMDCVNLLDKADVIHYCPPESSNWADVDSAGVSFTKMCTQHYLTHFHNHRPIIGFDVHSAVSSDVSPMLKLTASRASTNKQLWISGCSISHGLGVNEDERYGSILAKELNLPVSFLTAGGSSIQWAADQILRSDLQEGDILVWGITESARITHYQDNKVMHINGSKYLKNPKLNDTIPLDLVLGKGTMYHNVTCIHQVINFCKKLKVKLVLAGIFNFNPEFSTLLLSIPEYLFLSTPGIFIGYHLNFRDLGNDQEHPGPLTHQWYADQILTKLANDR